MTRGLYITQAILDRLPVDNRIAVSIRHAEGAIGSPIRAVYVCDEEYDELEVRRGTIDAIAGTITVGPFWVLGVPVFRLSEAR